MKQYMGLFERSDSDRARELLKKARDDPSAVSVSKLQDLLESEKAVARDNAARALSCIAEEYPEEVKPAVSDLHSLLSDDDDKVKGNAASALGEVAEEYPTKVKPAVSELHSLLADDDDMVRQGSTFALGHVSTEYPAEVKPAVSKLHSLLADDDDMVRQNAAGILGRVAEKYPAEVKPTVPYLHSLLNDEYKKARWNAASTLGDVAEEYPASVKPAVSDLHTLLNDDNDKVRQTAAEALGKVAEEYQEEVKPAITDLGVLLTDDTVEVAEKAADTLTTLAQTYPDQVRNVVQRHAPKRVYDIVGNSAEKSPQGDQISMHESRAPDISEVASPPPQSLSYDDDLEIADEPLGKGGQGIVYEATVNSQSELDQVGIKEISALGPTVEEDAHRELLSEADTWEMLARKEREKPRYNNAEKYEHIVGIIDSGDTPAAWIAMEYMDGGSLGQRLAEQDKGLPIAESLWIGKCLCRGVYLAHNEGTAHLDLKPSNILFRKTAPDLWDVPKIADWGMAQELATKQQDTNRFSPAYAAPEQFDIDHCGHPDTATDIYQLGAVIYEMLTGTLPHGEGLSKIKRAHTKEETPPPPSSRRSELSPVVDDCLQRALEPQKSERYRSISEFLRTLQDIELTTHGAD